MSDNPDKGLWPNRPWPDGRRSRASLLDQPNTRVEEQIGPTPEDGAEHTRYVTRKSERIRSGNQDPNAADNES